MNYIEPSGHIVLSLAAGVVLDIEVIITYSYIDASIKVNNDPVKEFKFKFNKKNNDYRVMIQFHDPARYMERVE